MADGVGLKSSPRDEMEVKLGVDSAQKKVELDLDDAPFLHEEKDDLPAEVDENAPAVPDEQNAGASPAAKAKRKKLLLLGGGVLVLLLAAAAAWWFFFRTPPPPPPDIKPEVVVVPTKQTPQAPPQYLKELEPFVVERPGAPDGKRFLVCKFSTLTKDAALDKEMDRKMIPLRDAMFYYLRGKSGEYLLAPENAAAVKKDLTVALNGYLTQGQIDDILFESYLSE